MGWYSHLDRLKNYVPDRLFAESVLPRVPIRLRAGGGPEYEDVSLTLSAAGYLPGKPTYRIGRERGFFIPLLNVFCEINNLGEVGPLLSKINDYYDVSLLDNKPYTLPDEYQYLIEKILKETKETIEITRLTSVNGDAFRCRLSDNNVGVRWVFYLPMRINLPFSNIFSNNINYEEFYVYLEKSNSYPRYFTAGLGAEPRQLSNKPIKFQCKALKSIFGNRIILSDANNDIYVGVYAFDVSAKIRGPLRINRNRPCIVRNRNNRNRTCLNNNQYDCRCVSDNISANVLVYNFVKIPMKIDNDIKTHPVIIGYVIKNTRYLEMRPTCLMQDELLDVFNDVKNSQINSDPSYAKLSINTALISMLRHILSHDLVIEHYLTLLGFTKPDVLINLVFLYYDLYNRDKLYTLLNNRNINDLSKKLIDIIREFLSRLNSNNILVLRYLLPKVRGGGQLEELHLEEPYINQSSNADEYWRKVQERLENILGNYNRIAENLGSDVWTLGMLFDVVRHTLGHHLIRVVSNSGGVRPDKLLEIYREITDQKVAIVERDAGGIGVLNVDNAGRLSIWRSDFDALEDLLLSLGKCLVGVPEDIIHFALVRRWNELASNRDNDVELRRVFKSVADELGIFLTPDELEETIKHWRSIYDEANKLAEIVNQNNPADQLKILMDVHELRYEFEREYKRFPDFDEFVVFTILNINNKYSYLKTLILTLFRRALISRGIANSIEQLFGGSNSSNPYDRFINEIQDSLSLYGRNTTIAQVIMRRRERVRRDVIHALIILRRVVSSVLTRLALLSCNSACGMCYLNTRSCGRFGSPFDQVRTLDRRVLRILASRIVRYVGEEVRPGAVLGSDGAIVELGGKEYVLRCADHDHSLQRA